MRTKFVDSAVPPGHWALTPPREADYGIAAVKLRANFVRLTLLVVYAIVKWPSSGQVAGSFWRPVRIGTLQSAK